MVSAAVRVMLALVILPVAAVRAAPAARQYVDPRQLDLPVPYYSFARQPWRSYLEVLPAGTFLQGLGVVWGAPVAGTTEDQVASAIAAAGFRRVRLEIPWGAMRWDEGGIVPAHAARTLSILAALKRHGLRPLILLNAHHGAPCPMRTTQWRVADQVPAGSLEVPLAGPARLIPVGRSMLPALGDGGRPGPLVTGISQDGRAIRLSRPLPAAMAAGDLLAIAELKYPPLAPAGTRDFEDTVAGWLKYVDYVTRLVGDIHGSEFDLELWNELTFGSAFLDAGSYSDAPPRTTGADVLHSGGQAWELARRTIDAVARTHPSVPVIWGFSNTTFFHTSVPDLPPRTAGQSYHPYGTGPRCHAKLVAGREKFNADGFVPTGCATMPEGWAQSFQQTESLMRLLNPAARSQRPPGSATFGHYITEHGFDPRELGLHDEETVARARGKFLLRAPLFWLNKGITGFYIFEAQDENPLGFGILARGSSSPATRALRRLVDRMGPARAPSRSLQLDVQVNALGPSPPSQAARALDRQVPMEDVVALLPFDCGEGRIVVAAYVMTEDFPRDLAPRKFRIQLKGVGGGNSSLSFYDPLADAQVPLKVVSRQASGITVEVELTDVPRLLEISG